jgi:hypothetical protein
VWAPAARVTMAVRAVAGRRPPQVGAGAVPVWTPTLATAAAEEDMPRCSVRALSLSRLAAGVAVAVAAKHMLVALAAPVAGRVELLAATERARVLALEVERGREPGVVLVV